MPKKTGTCSYVRAHVLTLSVDHALSAPPVVHGELWECFQLHCAAQRRSLPNAKQTEPIQSAKNENQDDHGHNTATV